MGGADPEALEESAGPPSRHPPVQTIMSEIALCLVLLLVVALSGRI